MQERLGQEEIGYIKITLFCSFIVQPCGLGLLV